jgi:hypothetical protein
MLTAKNRMHTQNHFYKYMTMKTAQTVLLGRKLRWSSPLIFKDPFDYARKLRFGFTTEQFVDALAAELKRMVIQDIKPMGNMEPAINILLEKLKASTDQQVAFEKIMKTLSVQNLEDLLSFKGMETAWEVYLPFMRILCLSETNESDSMWTHYADDYSGVVMQFGNLDETNSPMLAAKKVIYSDDAPVIGTLELFVKQFCGQVIYDYDKIFGLLEIIKKKHWEYEQEWRIISNDKQNTGKYTDIDFNPRTLMKIYLGYKANPANRDTIVSLCRFGLEHVEVYDATINHLERKQDFHKIQ